MSGEFSGEYYDYKKTMQPERPWLVDWHQRFVYRHMNATRGGTGLYSGDPEMAAARPRGNRWTFGDGKISEVCLRYEDSLEAIRKVFGEIYELVKKKHPLIFYGAQERIVDGLVEVYGMKMQPYERTEEEVIRDAETEVLIKELRRRSFSVSMAGTPHESKVMEGEDDGSTATAQEGGNPQES